MKKPVSPYNPANILSMLRIVLVPFFVVFLKEGKDVLAFSLFVAACLTDFLDGFLARRFQWQTKLGEFIDPVGDKLLTLSAYVLLELQDKIPFWVVVLAFAREIVVVTGYVLMAVIAGMTRVQVSWLGKSGTLLQMFSLGFFLATPFMPWSPGFEAGLHSTVAVAVVLSFLGGLDYALRGAHDFEKARKEKRA